MADDFAQSVDHRLRSVFEQVFQSKIEYRADLMRGDAKGWDSLKHVELMIALEIEFGIRMDGADATEITGVPSAAEIIVRKLA